MKLSGQILLFDEMTGILAPQYWRLRLAEECKRSERYLHFFSVLAIDISPFLWEEGKFLVEKLIEIANLLKSNVRSTDILSFVKNRYFAIILPETPQEGAEAVRRRLSELIRFTQGEKPGMKVAVYPRDGTSEIDLMGKVDLSVEGKS